MTDHVSAPVDGIREKLIEAFNASYIPTGEAVLDETSRHDGHRYSSACYVCRGDVGKLADAALSVIAPMLAAKDERIAVLQRSWDKARDANTAWLDGVGVVASEGNRVQ